MKNNAARETAVKEAVEHFTVLCPKAFNTKIDMEKLPNKTAFEALMQWDGDFPGPLCIGATGTGKTLCAWAVISKLAATAAYRVYATRPSDLISKVKSFGISYSFKRHLDRYDFIFMDSLEVFDFRDKESEQIVAEFYDYIYTSMRPCITTCENPLTFLNTKPSEHPVYSDPWLTRRIRDSHKVINF